MVPCTHLTYMTIDTNVAMMGQGNTTQRWPGQRPKNPAVSNSPIRKRGRLAASDSRVGPARPMGPENRRLRRSAAAAGHYYDI
jgi:hypothetical protein